MENNQTLTQYGSSNKLTTIQEVHIAESGKLIQHCTDEEIKQALRYIFTLIGLRANLIPQDEAKEVLIYFIKKRLWLTKIDELRLAFEYAIEKRTGVELSTFGDTFSAKLILEVLDAYKKYKISVVKSAPKPAGQNNYQIVENVLSQLNGETLEHLKKIGSPEVKKENKVDFKPPDYDLHQKWFKQFDKLVRVKEILDDTGRGTGFIRRYGKELNSSDYFAYKFYQMKLLKQRKCVHPSVEVRNKTCSVCGFDMTWYLKLKKKT